MSDVIDGLVVWPRTRARTYVGCVLSAYFKLKPTFPLPLPSCDLQCGTYGTYMAGDKLVPLNYVVVL